MSDMHLRILRGAARRARQQLFAHRAATVAPATEQEADADQRLERVATAADTRLAHSMDRRHQPSRTEHSTAELDALAAHARQRLALYRRKMYLGRGQANELAELERISAGAADRARRARRG